ncbi:MAG: RNA polymerase factor sigma-32 [bacterium]|nr:RNA polymerase factor sigma-32 [bacterium]
MTQNQLPILKNSVADYLVQINRFPLLSKKEEFDLALLYQEKGEIAAAHKLVTSNLRFVVKIAYEYGSYGIRIADLIQEGNIGLMKAVQKFDPRKGVRLISYAVWWIRAMIQSFILKNWSLVKIGTTQAQRKLFYKLKQTKRALLGEGREMLDDATSGKIAETLHVREEDVLQMEARMTGRDSSLDAPIHDDSDTRYLDLVPSSENQEDFVAKIEEQDFVRSKVKQVLLQLKERDRYIVQRRLMSDDPVTLQEVGTRYKISRERARQLEEGIKAKLKILLTEAVSPA